MHEMELQKEFFDFIESGTKRIEIRLNDEKRQKVKIGDIIKFSNKSDLTDTINVRVKKLHKFKSFNELTKKFDISLLADKDYSKKDLLNALNEIYSKEKQDKYGVLGIEFEIVKSKWVLVSSLFDIILGLLAIVMFFIVVFNESFSIKWIFTALLAILFIICGIMGIKDYKKR